jgi:hypothetical protein
MLRAFASPKPPKMCGADSHLFFSPLDPFYNRTALDRPVYGTDLPLHSHSRYMATASAALDPRLEIPILYTATSPQNSPGYIQDGRTENPFQFLGGLTCACKAPFNLPYAHYPQGRNALAVTMEQVSSHKAQSIILAFCS